MLDTPRIVQTAATPAAVIRLTVPRSEMQRVMGPAIQEVLAVLAAQGLAPAGPVFSHHWRTDPEVFDFEVGVPIDAPVAASGRVASGLLPAATVVRTVYRGPYEGLGAAWGEFQRWIAGSGRTPRPDLWECYVAGPESTPDPEGWQTELNQPVSEA